MERADMSENSIKGLWCVLDADDSDQLVVSEFRKFAELGALEKSSQQKFGGRDKSRHAGGGLSAFTANRAEELEGTA